MAIFYSIVSANKQDSQFSKLIETNQDLKTAAKEIKFASGNINTVLSDFPSHFKIIGSKIDDMADRFSSVNTQKVISEDKKKDYSRTIELDIDEDTFNKIIINLQFSAMVVLYYFFQSIRKSRSIDPLSFDNIEVNSNHYAVGFLNGFAATGLIEFKLYQNKIIPVKCHKLIYDNLRKCLDAVIEVIDKDQAEYLKKRIEKVDILLASNDCTTVQ